MLRTLSFVLWASCLLCGMPLSAQHTSTEEPSLPGRVAVRPAPPQGATAAPSRLSPADRGARPLIASRQILPWFEVDTVAPDGTTTLMALHNVADQSETDVHLSYFNTAGDLVFEDEELLDPGQIRTINLRDIPSLATSSRRFARGYVVVETDGELAADYFQVNPKANFATGGRLASTICRSWELRFLQGGGFSGGTRLQLYVSEPLGADPGTSPPSASIRISDESGERYGTVSVYTADPVVQIDVADLLATLPGRGPSFGALDVMFSDLTTGGIVQGTYRAQSRYSVSVPGSCTRLF